jgi:hypothetical protein
VMRVIYFVVITLFLFNQFRDVQGGNNYSRLYGQGLDRISNPVTVFRCGVSFLGGCDFGRLLAKDAKLRTAGLKGVIVEVRDRVGKTGRWFIPILDVIWPSWTEQEKDRLRLTLRASIKSKNIAGVSEADIDAFAGFLADEGLSAFFWRLKSFEDHVFRANEFALEGMKSDLQGMAVAVEHVVFALGGSKTQLYEKFKQVWKNPHVLGLLKRGDVSPLARTERLAQNWDALKTQIDALRNEPGGIIAADLVMAHRIRGGVHTILPEDDQLELEALFLALMRAAIFTFVEVRKTESLNETISAPTPAPGALTIET